MPVVRISWWKGRGYEQKVELARELTQVLERVAKIPPEATQIIFEDVDKENWAIGGVMASERK
jgi:4-oxalocrotonate tautomerase